MKEQSQIEEMRAAIRGDLERSRARREPVVTITPEPEAAEEQTTEDEPRPGLLAAFFRRG